MSKLSPVSEETRLPPLDLPEIPLPAFWDQSVKKALLAAFTLAHFTIVNLRAWGHSTRIPAVQKEVQLERLDSEIALLREQLRIVSARLERALSKPHFQLTSASQVVSEGLLDDHAPPASRRLPLADPIHGRLERTGRNSQVEDPIALRASVDLELP